MTRAAARTLGSIILVVALAACSGTGSNSATSTATSVASGAGGGGGGTTVNVTETEFKIEADATSAPAGQVTFNIKNNGTIAHEFVVIKTDDAASALPVASGESVVDEDQLTGIDEKEDIEPGTSVTLTVNLEAGHYALICNVEGHYTSGMRLDFTVS
jgi:uncharacterized cupredoxin-like copper-binding protein